MFVQKLPALILVACFACFFLGCSGESTVSGREKGAQEATASIAAGDLVIKQYPPLPSPPGHEVYVQLLQDRCGVSFENPSLPSGTEEAIFIQEIQGWNEVMKAELRRQFGADILETLNQESQQGATGLSNATSATDAADEN